MIFDSLRTGRIKITGDLVRIKISRSKYSYDKNQAVRKYATTRPRSLRWSLYFRSVFV